MTPPPCPGAGPLPAVSVVPLEGLDPEADAVVLPVVRADGDHAAPDTGVAAPDADDDAARPAARLALPRSAALSDLLRDCGVDLDRRLRRARATGDAGAVVVVDLEREHPDALLLLGTGDAAADAWRRAGAALARASGDRDDVLVVWPGVPDPHGARAFAEGLLLGSYRWQWRRRPTPPRTARYRVAVAARAVEECAAAVARGVATAEATRLARDLANTPSNVKSPAWLVRQARDVAARHGLAVRVWDVAALRAEGFGGLLAVGGGSVRPPALVRLDHRPAAAGRADPVVLVGKGITFDSGGLSIKPAAAMTPMKTDMAGAAAVLAVMSALSDLGVDVPVTALLAVAENLPSGSAYRPADVVTHYGGRTTEVTNTDAEGRLVLADALAYAVRECRPAAVVDVATLTGAATVALGRGHAALLTPDDALARALLRAGEQSGDRAWRLPLVADYADALRSHLADSAQVARGRIPGAGAIVAALFLQPFAAGVPWAHLDIAGPARAEADRFETSRGGTGAGTRLLLRWLETR